MGKGDEIQQKFDGRISVIISSDIQADIDQPIVPTSKRPLPAIYTEHGGKALDNDTHIHHHHP
jgi:hypothetical protein